MVASKVLLVLGTRGFLRDDPVTQVRSAGVLSIELFFRETDETDLFPQALALLREVLDKEGDSFVLRTLLHVLANVTFSLAAADRFDEAKALFRAFVPGLVLLRRNSDELTVRRWAALCREKMYVWSDRERFSLYQELAHCLAGLQIGKRRQIPGSLRRQTDEETFCRILAVLSQDDAGFTLNSGILAKILGCRVTRGDCFAFRFWRLLHELRHPSPDKRQAHSHTVGRVFPGNIRIPGPIMAVLTRMAPPNLP